ncbi:ferredoxin [Candidatus Woesearchaeota archaeon]|nr:ferredoxin [Candidatus Woesearchaeota archaeon]
MVKVDQEKCIGCGACLAICPDMFELKDGKSVVKNQDANCDVKQAIESCPTNAISS